MSISFTVEGNIADEDLLIAALTTFAVAFVIYLNSVPTTDEHPLNQVIVIAAVKAVSLFEVLGLRAVNLQWDPNTGGSPYVFLWSAKFASV